MRHHSLLSVIDARPQALVSPYSHRIVRVSGMSDANSRELVERHDAQQIVLGSWHLIAGPP